MTNKHVVEKGFVIKVRAAGARVEARITHLHPNQDLCQITVENLRSPGVSLRDSTNIAVGERVYAIGAPLGFDLTMSEGLVSGLRSQNGEKVIQTTAPISEGSSGGGLFDSEANLIGITTYYIKGGQNLNFALPAKLVSSLAQYSVATAPSALTAQKTLAAMSPVGLVHSRLKMGFPETSFEVYADSELVIHVVWIGFPSLDQVREYLRSLILRRELPNPEFDFERKERL